MTKKEKSLIEVGLIRLANIAADRAMTTDWKHHPMHGILVDKDRYALDFQSVYEPFKKMLYQK